jgi:hypothetical protein
MGFHRGPKIVTDGLVLYLDAANTRSYPGTGTTLTDLSGSGRNGTATEAVGYTSSNGGGMVINAQTAGIVVGNLSTLTEFTIGGWFKRTGAPGTYGRIYGANPIDRGDIAILSNTLQLNGPNASWVGTGIPIALDETAYILVYFNRTTRASKVWKNGVLGYNVIQPNADEGAISSYTIGNRADYNWEYTPGIHYMSQIYNRELTTAEILQNYNATKSRYNL